MHGLFKLIILTIVIVITVYGLDSEMDQQNKALMKSLSTDLLEVEARRRKDHYFIHPYHGWYALSWIYWIKVKLIVVAFFAYLTFIWAWSYLAAYAKRCQKTGHHVYYSGHYRSLDALEIPKSLQNIPHNPDSRSVRKRSRRITSKKFFE